VPAGHATRRMKHRTRVAGARSGVPPGLGTALHAGRVENVFNALRDAATLPAHSCHVLRHSYASLALPAGVPLETVSENLGHRDIPFTKRVYAHVLLEAKHAGAELMDAVIRGV
jgi:integrase